MVLEDAISGVQAGRAGGFALVVGVDRSGQTVELRRNGADRVVSDLARLHIRTRPTAPRQSAHAVPRILHPPGAHGRPLAGNQVVVFPESHGPIPPQVPPPSKSE